MFGQTYIYTGTEATRAALHRGHDRAEVQPGQTVQATVKLGGSFVIFDDKVLDKVQNEIKENELALKAKDESYDVIIKEVKARHKEELDKIESDRKAELSFLQNRLDRSNEHKDFIVKNIHLAKGTIDEQIKSLEATKVKLEGVKEKKTK